MKNIKSVFLLQIASLKTVVVDCFYRCFNNQNSICLFFVCRTTVQSKNAHQQQWSDEFSKEDVSLFSMPHSIIKFKITPHVPHPYRLLLRCRELLHNVCKLITSHQGDGTLMCWSISKLETEKLFHLFLRKSAMHCRFRLYGYIYVYIFSHICVHICVHVHICVCVCVCALTSACAHMHACMCEKCVFVQVCVNIFIQVAKMLQKMYVKSNISSRMAQVLFFSSLTFTFIFKVRLLVFYLFCKYLINGER